MLRICNFFKKKELDSLKKHFSTEDIISNAKKVQKGIGVSIKGLPQGSMKYLKLRIHGKNSAGRILHALIISHKKDIIIYPLILRLKKDKKLGENLSAQNKEFLDILKKYLPMLEEDIKEVNFDEYKV